MAELDADRVTTQSVETVFGDRADRAQRFHDLLVDQGVLRGLIGPRETSRLWERHLLNSAVLGEAIPSGASVVDVGSGAGFPGVPLALARPDLRIVLLEPMLRRTTWLTEIKDELGLEYEVVRGRAEDGAVRRQIGEFDVVTSRAVAPLDRLAGWCLPLTRVGGSVLAMKGSSVEDEIQTHSDAVRRLGGGEPTVVSCGVDVLTEPSLAVRIEMISRPSTQSKKKRRR